MCQPRAGAVQVRCGITLFNAGSNVPAVSCALTEAGTVRMQDEAGNAAVTVPVPDAVGLLTAVYLRVWRNATASSWQCQARAADPGDWSTVSVNDTTAATVSDLSLLPFQLADLWWGVSLRVASSPAVASAAAGVTGTAAFPFVRIAWLRAAPAAAIPVVADVFGRPDVCAARATVVPVLASVAGTSNGTQLDGLAANFPYTVAVTAYGPGGEASPPSAPVGGGWLWPRPMPPRAHMLGLWLDGKWLPNGALSRWPDNSGNGHDLVQPTPALRPNVRGGDLYSPSIVEFVRARGTFLTGGSDAIDLGFAPGSSYTLYMSLRPTSSTFQVLAGRGTCANTLDGSWGWAAAIFNTRGNPSPGLIGLLVGDGAGTRAGASNLAWQDTRNTNTRVNFIMAANYTAGDFDSQLPGAPASSGFNLSSCRETSVPCGPGYPSLPGFDWPLATASNFTRGLTVAYNDSGAAADFATTAQPAVDGNLAFRVGAGSSPQYAYSGDMAQLVLYRELHDAATRAAVVSFMNGYTYDSLCPSSILTPNVNYWGGSTCSNGGLGSNCYAYGCSDGFANYLGTLFSHTCTSGYWSGAPLICRRACSDLPPPRYVQGCARTWFTVDFANDPLAPLYFITWPVLRIYAAQLTWSVTPGTGVLVGNTTQSDSCERITTAANVYAIHPSRWNLYIPYGVMVNVTASVTVQSGSAGVVCRFTDANNYYRVELSPSAGVSLVRVASGRSTTLATAGNVTVWAGVSYNVSIWAQTPNLGVVINNVTVITVADVSGPSFGSAGFYIGPASLASFSNMTIASGCDLGMVARYMVSAAARWAAGAPRHSFSPPCTAGGGRVGDVDVQARLHTHRQRHPHLQHGGQLQRLLPLLPQRPAAGAEQHHAHGAGKASQQHAAGSHPRHRRQRGAGPGVHAPATDALQRHVGVRGEPVLRRHPGDRPLPAGLPRQPRVPVSAPRRAESVRVVCRQDPFPPLSRRAGCRFAWRRTGRSHPAW